jgi:hypothetical protein
METGNKKEFVVILVAIAVGVVIATAQLFRQGDFWLGVISIAGDAGYFFAAWRLCKGPVRN